MFSDLVVILSHILHHTTYCVVILRSGEAANSSLAEFYLWFIIKCSIIICISVTACSWSGICIVDPIICVIYLYILSFSLLKSSTKPGAEIRWQVYTNRKVCTQEGEALQSAGQPADTGSFSKYLCIFVTHYESIVGTWYKYKYWYIFGVHLAHLMIHIFKQIISNKISAKGDVILV